MIIEESLRETRDLGGLVSILINAFCHPEEILTAEQWRADEHIGRVVAETYKKLDSEQKTLINKAAQILFRRWTEKPPEKTEFNNEPRLELSLFIALAMPPEILPVLEELINQRIALKNSPDWHAHLLSHLQDYLKSMPLYKRYSFDFWKEQHKLLNGKYPAVIWGGMLQVDLDRAFEFLGELATTKEAAKEITDLFGWVSKRLVGGDDDLRRHLVASGDLLNNEAKEEFNRWFGARKKELPWPDL